MACAEDTRRCRGPPAPYTIRAFFPLPVAPCACSITRVDYWRPIPSRGGSHVGGVTMKTSTARILTTHVGSIPRPESIRTLLRARLGGQAMAESELAARTAEAVADVVRR